MGKCLCLFMFLAIVIAPGHAQVNDGQQTLDETEQNSTTSAAPGDAASQTDGNALTLGLDAAPGDPPAGTPSFLLGGLFVSESAQTEPNLAGQPSVYSVPRVLAKVDLLKLWHRSVTAFNYIGGGIFYPSGAQQIQQFTASQRFLMGRRQLTLSDSYGYFYGGSFGASSLGGGGLSNLISPAGAGGPVSPGSPIFSGATNFGGIGTGPSLTNVGQAVFADALTRRSSVVLASFYGITSYKSNGEGLISSRQFSGVVAYNYQLSPRSAVSVLYGYRAFRYPYSATTSIADNLVHLSYQRRLSNRMRIALGVGPETTSLTTRMQIIRTPPTFLTVNTNQVNASVSGSLGYSWGRIQSAFSYQRLTTGGSGVSAGANSDIAQGSATRRVFGAWEGSLDSGYARLRQIGSVSSTAAASYHYWYAGAAVRRNLPNNLGFFASYQYNKENSNNSLCAVNHVCGSGRNIFLVGLSWRARPIRLDHGGEDVGTDTSDTSAADQSGHQ